jgi:hypothetical protein
MSGAVRLKERIVVFMGLAVFGVVYLSCRSLDCILHLYVAAHNFKHITMVAAVYSASKLLATMYVLCMYAHHNSMSLSQSIQSCVARKTPFYSLE